MIMKRCMTCGTCWQVGLVQKPPKRYECPTCEAKRLGEKRTANEQPTRQPERSKR